MTRVPLLLVLLGGLVCQMGLGYNYVFGALAPDILSDFGWTKAEFAGARAPQLWVMALASPLVGFLAVRFGPRSVLVGSTVLLGVSFLLLSRMDALWQLYAVLCVQALSVTGLGDITVGQAVSRWFTEHRGLALGVVYTGSNLGGALLVRSAGLFEGAGGWRSVFEWMGATALLVMLPVAFFAVREPKVARPTSFEEQDVPGEDDDLDFVAALRTRSFWILAFSLFTFFFYFVAVLDHLVLFLTEQGFTRGDAQAHLSNAILLGMASKIAFGFVADRMSAKGATLLDYGLLTVSSLVLFLPTSPAAVWLFVLVFGFSAPARDVVYPVILLHCFGVRSMAQIYGVLMLVLPAGALGAWLAGAISDQSGSYGPAFTIFAIANALSFLALVGLRDERRYST